MWNVKSVMCRIFVLVFCAREACKFSKLSIIAFVPINKSVINCYLSFMVDWLFLIKDTLSWSFHGSTVVRSTDFDRSTGFEKAGYVKSSPDENHTRAGALINISDVIQKVFFSAFKNFARVDLMHWTEIIRISRGFGYYLAGSPK